jgi:succinoglycan biosynthesis protein ExoM
MLERSLDGLLALENRSAFTMEIVITDNDGALSARDVVRRYQAAGACPVIYDGEPEQSIALARNRTVRNATGNLIATMDDDEVPAKDWLFRMFTFLKETGVDGVLGPVLPRFPPGAPAWLGKSGLCERPRHASGTAVGLGDLRTGNALFERRVFEPGGVWFDPARGQGGEDGEFLTRQIKGGRKFLWCNEAVVYETVSPDRWPAGYYLKRYFTIGAMAGEYHRLARHVKTVPASALSLMGSAAAAPFAFLLGKHVGMKVWTKWHYHAGYLLAFFKMASVPRRR